MQHRTLKILSIAGMATLLVVAGTAYWIGLQIEQQAAHIEAVEHFERGWFFSDMSSRLVLPDRALPEISLQHQIYHGPLPFISAHTALRKSSPWCRRSALLCTGEHRLLVSKIGLTGNSYHNFDIPLLQLDLVSGLLAISGLKGELQIPLLNETPQGLLQTSLANLSWEANDGAAIFRLSELTLQSSLNTAGVYLTGDLALTARHFIYGPERAGPGEIRLQADRFNYLLLRRLMFDWQRYERLSPDFFLRLQELLSQRPKITLRRSRLKTAYGDLELEGELLLHAVNMLKLLTQPLLLIDAARIDIRAARELLETFAGRSENGAALLAHWRQNGSVSLDGDSYRARLRIREGRVYLNDTVLTLF